MTSMQLLQLDRIDNKVSKVIDLEEGKQEYGRLDHLYCGKSIRNPATCIRSVAMSNSPNTHITLSDLPSITHRDVLKSHFYINK